MAQTSNLKAVIIIIVIIIVGGLIYFVSLQNQSETVNTNQNVNEQSSEDKGFVYTNEEFSYQITFLEGWEMDDTSASSLAAFYDPVALLQTEATELYMGMKMEIYSQTVKDDVTLESYINNEIYSDEPFEQTDVIVDGEPAIKVKVDTLGYAIATYVIKDGHIFIIAGYIGNGDDVSKYTAKYSSIIDSMTFLD
ncbi:PsbP-related protein [Patescibacteria group bacterium]